MEDLEDPLKFNQQSTQTPMDLLFLIPFQAIQSNPHLLIPMDLQSLHQFPHSTHSVLPHKILTVMVHPQPHLLTLLQILMDLL